MINDPNGLRRRGKTPAVCNASIYDASGIKFAIEIESLKRHYHAFICCFLFRQSNDQFILNASFRIFIYLRECLR